ATADGILDGFTLLHVLVEALHVRPDLWQAWSAVVQQLTYLSQLDRALSVATSATERFPLLPKLLLDLAEIHRRRFDVEGERAALDQALRINPRLGPAVRQLADTYERENNDEKARQLLEKLVTHTPLDPVNHAWYAGVLWRLGQKEKAIEHLKTAVQLNP